MRMLNITLCRIVLGSKNFFFLPPHVVCAPPPPQISQLSTCFPQGLSRQHVDLTTVPHLMLRLIMCGAISPLLIITSWHSVWIKHTDIFTFYLTFVLQSLFSNTNPLSRFFWVFSKSLSTCYTSYFPPFFFLFLPLSPFLPYTWLDQVYLVIQGVKFLLFIYFYGAITPVHFEYIGIEKRQYEENHHPSSFLLFLKRFLSCCVQGSYFESGLCLKLMTVCAQ
jgi:hypothetical protein